MIKTDYAYYGIAAVCIVILVIVWVITYYNNRKISNDEVYKKLFVNNPAAVAFCIGKQPDGTYLNVYLNEDGNAEEKYEKYPINEAGNPIFTKPHGDITELENGFKISGISPDFTCPSGYEGPNCTPIAPCNNEDGVVKPITYTMFNALGLNKNQFDYLTPSKHKFAEEPINNRLYIQCLTGKNYEVHSCNYNQVLNTDDIKNGKVTCISYDICKENLNGYIHNIDPNGKELQDNQYFICAGGKSEPKTCEEGYVYSDHNKSCMIENRCFNNDGATFPYSDSVYILCEDDIEKKIQCVNGVDESKVACIGSKCVESRNPGDSDLFPYIDEAILCNEDNTKTVVDCRGPMEYYALDDTQKYSYPQKIYDEDSKKCIDSDVMKMTTNSVQYNFNQALISAHPYNIVKKAYDCTSFPDSLGVIDYMSKTVTLKNGKTDSMFNYPLDPPCVVEKITPIRFAPILTAKYYPELVAWILYDNVPHTDIIHLKLKDGVYTYTAFTLDYYINTYTSKKPPIGFNDDCSYLINKGKSKGVQINAGMNWNYETPSYRSTSDIIDHKKILYGDPELAYADTVVFCPQFPKGKLSDGSANTAQVSWTEDVITVGTHSVPRTLNGLVILHGEYLAPGVQSSNLMIKKGDPPRKCIQI